MLKFLNWAFGHGIDSVLLDDYLVEKSAFSVTDPNNEIVCIGDNKYINLKAVKEIVFYKDSLPVDFPE